ncbi:uncharacterized protein [Parasteatoda tepidariorum]|uniref:uncharacterized protein n=1 Tax=Parasteatoda tepidariorum TaxID=114398 RepID=UPI0039BC6B77
MRLADGTITGTYGLVDDQGQKRVVHYSAGTGGFVAKEDKILNQTIKPVPRVSYQQLRKFSTRAPMKTIPLHTSKHSILEQPQKYMLVPSTPSLNRKPTSEQNRVVQNPMLQTEASLHSDKPSTSLTGAYHESKPIYQGKPQYTSVEEYRMPQVDTQSGSKQHLRKAYREPNRKTISRSKLSSVELYSPMKPQRVEISSRSMEDTYPSSKFLSREESTETMPTLSEEPRGAYEQEPSNPDVVNYNEFPGLLKNELKVSTVPSYEERSQDFLKGTHESSFNTRREKNIVRNPNRFSSVNMQTDNKKFEDEYYDNSPVYIDVERLSYNIGTGKSSSEY